MLKWYFKMEFLQNQQQLNIRGDIMLHIDLDEALQISNPKINTNFNELASEMEAKQDKSTLMTQALTLQPGFEVYNAQEGNTLLVRKYGAVVELVGSITLSESNPAQIGGATSILMTQIPASYRPKVNVYFVQQGSGAAKWFLEVHTDGNVYAYRYSIGDTYSNPTPGSWLPVYANFLCE